MTKKVIKAWIGKTKTIDDFVVKRDTLFKEGGRTDIFVWNQKETKKVWFDCDWLPNG